jgi:Protein of unknown function (DUF3775)
MSQPGPAKAPVNRPAAANFELAIDPAKVAIIIDKARMFDVKEASSDPDSGSNATDDDMRDILEESADDSTYQELLEMIRDLDVDEQVTLVALAWVGRGTYEPEDWADALNEARSAHNAHTAEYLTGLPLLGDYLAEGLSAIEQLSEP